METDSENQDRDRNVQDISDDYAPTGGESDDDVGSWCHWSTHGRFAPGTIQPASQSTSDHAKLAQRFPNSCKPHDLVETFIDNDYLNMCIDGTNGHANDDPEFQK